MSEVVISTEPLQGIDLVIANRVYENARSCLLECFTSPSIDDTILVLKTLTTVASLLESTKVNGDQKVRGQAKKKIVLHVSQKLIYDLVSFLHIERLSTLFDRVSDDLIEICIDFAKNNKVIRNIHLPCKTCSYFSC